jgi:uronate dehydrogenase
VGHHPAINIVGTYNLFEAARRKGVKRVVFASSNHVVGFYPRDQRIGVEVTALPDTRYGVSKAFGESLGAFYAYKLGLEVLCLRIGNVSDQPTNLRLASIWLKPEDLVQLIRIGLEHPDIRYEIFYGVSANTRGWWDNSIAYRYGYKPSGDSETLLKARGAGRSRPIPSAITIKVPCRRSLTVGWVGAGRSDDHHRPHRHHPPRYPVRRPL